MQIDGLSGRIPGTVQGIIAAAVVDRQRGRPTIRGKIKYRSRGVVEAIDGVAGPGGRGTIDLIDRVDVGHLRRDHIAVRAARMVVLREIRHDGILPGVVGIGRVRRICRAAIVWTLMAETERVADLVNVGLVSVAIYSGLAVECAAVTGDPVGA